jgi:hypothetical protein
LKRAFFNFLVLACAALAFVSGAFAGAGPSAKATLRSAPILDDEAARTAGLSSQELKDATKLYTAKCMRCHKSYEPSSYGPTQWESWMVKMRKKARLTSDQYDLLSRYLEAYRAGSSPTKTNSAATR